DTLPTEPILDGRIRTAFARTRVARRLLSAIAPDVDAMVRQPASAGHLHSPTRWRIRCVRGTSRSRQDTNRKEHGKRHDFDCAAHFPPPAIDRHGHQAMDGGYAEEEGLPSVRLAMTITLSS